MTYIRLVQDFRRKAGCLIHFVWEPMNYEGFRKLSYNASDQKNAELMAPVYKKCSERNTCSCDACLGMHRQQSMQE